MSHVVKTILSPLALRLERVQRKFSRSRPGSVLIMVVALLVLLALMGTAYLATARQDRLAAGQIKDNGLDTAVTQAANDALASALNWLLSDPQTFTTTSLNSANVSNAPSFSGPLLASRMPTIYSKGTVVTSGSPPAPGSSTDPWIVRWERLTTPQGYGQFASPIPSPKTTNTAYPSFPGYNGGNPGNNYNLTDPTIFYDFSPEPLLSTAAPQPGIPFWAVPTSITISYPAKGYQGSSDLAGKTFTFPAFWKANVDYDNGAYDKYIESGPYLAGDADGDGIADCGLVQLNLPSVNGVTFFAGWRVVDNAAAVNLNTAWGPNPYHGAAGDQGGTLSKSNMDGSGNAYNFFPTDVDIYSFLRSIYNQNDTYSQAEMPTLQFRRAASQAGGDYSNSYFADGAVNPRTDVQYIYRGESMWWNLGRRLNSPLNLTGDPLDGMRRPFNEADTIALGNRGIMCDPSSPGSKIEQVFAGLKNNASDSIYRDAVNYMTLPQNRFSIFPANSIAYWYDWNYNLSHPLQPQPGAGSVQTAVGLFKFGTGANDQTDKLYLGPDSSNQSAFGYCAGPGGSQSVYAFRTPRPYFVGSNPVANVTRYIDDSWLPAIDVPSTSLPTEGVPPAQGSGTTAGNIPGITAMSKQTTAHSKVSLNTSDFPELWRAFANVFNDFNPEDGATSTVGTNGTFTLQVMRDALGYELRDPNGYNPVPSKPQTAATGAPFTNPCQLRNVIRDSGDFDSYSYFDATTKRQTSTTNGAAAAAAAGGGAGNNNVGTYPAYWLDCRNMVVLRAALAAVNVMTLRDQHGALMTDANNASNKFFAPDVYKQIIPLKVSKDASLANQVNAATNVYGAAPQPYITEVYVSTDTSSHTDPTGQAANGLQNLNGLIVIKLYNPYPFDLVVSDPPATAPANTVRGYDIAVVNRTRAGTNGVMTVSLVSRTDPTKSLFAQDAASAFNGKIPANGYILLTNFDPSTGYWPKYGATPTPPATSSGWPAAPTKSATNVVFIPGLADAIGGTTPTSGSATPPQPNTNTGSELLILRPLAADAINAANEASTHYYWGQDFTTAEVPVDAFDLSGLSLAAAGTTTYYNWHYLRQSGNANDGKGPDGNPVSWRCVFPGIYSGSGDFTKNTHIPAVTPGATAGAGKYAGPNPHFFNTDVGMWDTSKQQKDPWDTDQTNTATASTDTNNTLPTWHMDPAAGASTASTYNNPFPGIQVCNIDFGGTNKRNPTLALNSNIATFPYGGFARVGDVQQAPFIGSYVIRRLDTTTFWPPKPATASQPATTSEVLEANPVTMDSAYVDDGDTSDDAFEQLGRFVPIVDSAFNAANPSANVNDFWPSGFYAPGQVTGTAPLTDKNNGQYPYGELQPTRWRYHFAQEIFNQFTTIANPGEDYFPNMHSSAWFPAAIPTNANPNPTPPNVAPVLVPSSSNAVEGLINVNTADWRTLASVEMIPRSIDTTGALNVQLAKAIVYYRDVNDLHPRYMSWTMQPDGTYTPTPGQQPYYRGHGPFNSLAELNDVVPDPTNAPTVGFRTAMGKLTAGSLSSTSSRHQWGYYIPASPGSFNGPSDNSYNQTNDWLEQNLMVERVSNLLTTRSDSFTVYIIVQGWRNAFQSPSNFNQAWPELVVQKRLAVTVDRSAVTSANKTVKTTAFPTK